LKNHMRNHVYTPIGPKFFYFFTWSESIEKYFYLDIFFVIVALYTLRAGPFYGGVARFQVAVWVTQEQMQTAVPEIL
ncbi:hypothetical protein ACJX0J_032574, partial [Zea mays]